MVLLRRWLVLVSLAFWQGGFMFYGAIVIPVGSEVLGSHAEQARVTRPVTNYLNLAGAVALVFWCWDGAAKRGAGSPGRSFWLGWGLLVLLLVVQVWLHGWMDDLLDMKDGSAVDRPGFGWLHRWYLLASTVQWIGAMGLLAWTIRAWGRGDRTNLSSGR
jgi:hypothetical protein